MENVLIVVHLIFVVTLIGLVLLQKSEGGALGIGGGGGVMSSRGAANAISKLTGYCAAGFFATSLALAIIAGAGVKTESILDRAATPAVEKLVVPAVPTTPSVPLNSDSKANLMQEIDKLNANKPAAIPAAPVAPKPTAPSVPKQ